MPTILRFVARAGQSKEPLYGADALSACQVRVCRWCAVAGVQHGCSAAAQTPAELPMPSAAAERRCRCCRLRPGASHPPNDALNVPAPSPFNPLHPGGPVAGREPDAGAGRLV